jgi:phosphoribosylformylglycinamidine (FGAM) synthase-like amidotransferase family enzyme
MNAEEIKVCVMRVGGTNCDAETQRAFQELGVQAESVHVNELIKRRNLLVFWFFQVASHSATTFVQV